MAGVGFLPRWVVGISVGAINAALIAGNAPERRSDRLREFWELVSAQAARSARGNGLRAPDDEPDGRRSAP